MATYTQLQADVNEMAGRTVATIAYTLLTSELNSRLRLTLMESTSTITANAESESLPADFLQARSVYVDDTFRTPIEIVSEFSSNVTHRDSGAPCEAVIVDGAMLFNPVPDGDYTVHLRYLASLADLSGGSDTNAVMDAHYAIYLYGTLKHHTAKTRDEKTAAYWGGLFEQAIATAEMADKDKRYSASPLRMRPRAVA